MRITGGAGSRTPVGYVIDSTLTNLLVQQRIKRQRKSDIVHKRRHCLLFTSDTKALRRLIQLPHTCVSKYC